jgi:hypothetical protein
VKPLGRDKTRKKEQYSCSNPNCGRTFSRPKVIKYLVCPTCQTLVSVTEEDQPATQEIAAPLKKQAMPKKQKTAKLGKKQEPKTEPSPIQEPIIAEENPPTKKKQKTHEMPVILEQAHTLKSEAKAVEPTVSLEPKKAEQVPIYEQTTNEESGPVKEKPEITETPAVSEQILAPEPEPMAPKPTASREPIAKEETTASTSSACKYGFGYLSQREKGEQIPTSCVECPSAIDCMLSKYYKEKETVKEIKKWYET